MAEPFDTAKDVVSRQRLAIIESTATPGQPVHAVCNPDGTNISATGGGATGIFPTVSAIPAVPTSGSAVVAAGPTSTPLSALAAHVAEVSIISNILNTANIQLGDSATQTLEMEPGRDIVLHNVDLNDVFIFGTVGEGVTWFATT